MPSGLDPGILMLSPCSNPSRSSEETHTEWQTGKPSAERLPPTFCMTVSWNSYPKGSEDPGCPSCSVPVADMHPALLGTCLQQFGGALLSLSHVHVPDAPTCHANLGL